MGEDVPCADASQKKILLEAAKIVDASQRHENKGITNSEAIRIKWPDLIRFKRTFTDSFPGQREDSYRNLGIIPFHGHARFIGPATIMVESDGDGGNVKGNSALEGKHILIATGSIPSNLNIPGYENAITSDQCLECDSDHLPEKIVFVGGGYISFEFAHIAVRAGCQEVTILHRGKQPLEHFDPDLVKQLVQSSQEIGIDIRLQSAVK